MEDMMKALLDVVRAQHTATEGSEERPFDINDIIDMALNITGRPEEPEEQQELSDTIQKLAESLAPDIFPPKTFEEMDDSEQAASAVNMIEERLRNGGRRRETAAPQSQQEMTPQQNSSQMQSESHEENPFAQVMENENANIQQQSETADGYGNMASTDSGASEDYGNGSSYDMFGQDDVNHQEAANLNDLIYNNFMQMMGLNDPKVEYPFDRSQIRYGREKTATEMLAEDEANKAEERALEEQRRRPVSAWELAQSAVDKDEEAHQKEEYEPKEMKMPETKSASQLAAEAIAKAKEEDQMKLEAEKRAERLMEEARKRGKDPMEFALHQQEILNYMEKNSDELVSFEDYEDLSPEEKLEIEKELYREKQIEAGVAPEDISDELPDEILEQAGIAPDQTAGEQNSQEPAGQGDGTTAQQTSQSQGMSAFSDDMLRMISQEVVQENAEMILAEDANADLGLINEMIFENLKNLMSQTGGAVTQEDMESLIGEVISRNTSSDSEETQETLAQTETGTTAETAPMAFEGESAGSAVGSGMAGTREPAVESSQSESQSQPMSAVELARAAQQAAKPEPQEARETKSAVELAKEAQENAVQKKAEPISETEEELSEDDLNFDELDLEEESEESQSPSIEELKAQLKAAEEALAAEQLKAAQKAGKAEEEKKSEEIPKVEEATEQPMEESASTAGKQTATEESSEITPAPTAEEVQEQPEYSEVSEKEAEEFEYVDPGELVLGDHTQAEIDEALDNLASLGLEGEVYERAKRMLLLELAGSEVALDAWLEEQENGKKKKAAVSALDTEEDALEDLEDLDEDDLERELELAMDEDFIEEDLEEPANEETLEESSQDKSEETEKEAVPEEDLEENSVEKTEDESDKTEGAEDVSEQPESILKEASEEEISSEEENSEEEEGETSEAAQEEAANKEYSETEEKEAANREFSETEEEAANREYSETEEKETANSECSETEEKETANSECSETEEKEIANKEVSKKTEKEAEYKEAEYISESEDTIQVEKTRPEKAERTSSQTKKPAHSERTSHSRKHKNIVKRKEKTAPEKEEREFSAVVLTGKNVEEKEFQVSVRNPFVLKNSASFMDKFEEYIVDTQENRKLSTGFKRLDAMLRYGLHKGSYFVDATPQYLKNGFMQQIADQAAESGVDVLYISTELTRYDLMVDTISRLSYEMNKKDEEKAVSSMAIMTGEKGADIRSLKDELNWYRGRISEHLFVLDQEAVSEYVENMEDASAGDILAELIRSIVTEGAHKPVVFIDNIENILSVEDSEDMKPLMDGIRKLAKELGIPIIMSYGYAPAESENELDPDEIEYHKSLGNMCDVYLELKYADMITEDYEELTEDDIQEMVENGEMLLINVQLHKNRRTMKASCQIQATPKFNYYEE